MTDTAQCPHFLIGRVLNKAEATAPVVLEKTFCLRASPLHFVRWRAVHLELYHCVLCIYIYTVLYNVELFGSLKDFSCSSLSS